MRRGIHGLVLGVSVCLLAASAGADIASTGFEVPATGSSSHDGSGEELGFVATPAGTGHASAHVVSFNARTASQALLLDDQTSRTNFDVVFDPVDLTGYDDVMLSFYWYTPGTEYESASQAGNDWLTATATFTGAAGSPITFLDIDGGDMDLNSAYELASVRLPVGATSVTLSIAASSSWGNDAEQIYLDDVRVAPYVPPPPPVEVSGIYPHLAVFNSDNECGIGAVVPWADKLRYVTYPPHKPTGSGDKLYSTDADLNVSVESASVGGTHANRMIHTESDQLIIGPYFIDSAGVIRTVSPSVMPGRLTATARHLTDPENKVYFFTMEEGLYEVDVHTLAVTELHKDLNGGGTNLLPGDHGKGAYTGQGHLIVANNGGGGVLAEWDGTGDAGDPASWTIVDQNKYTDVTGPGGLTGSPDDDAPVWALGWDSKSVLLNVRDQGTWTRYRLPKASHTQDADHGWYTEWPRIRDVGEENLLMDMHCMFYELPETFSTTNTAGIAPISSHLKMVADFAEWNGQIVMACDDASKLDNPCLGQSQSNLWFTTADGLRQLGSPTGWGGPLVRESIDAGAASEAFLFAGFEKRVVHLAHTGTSDATFTLEVDRDGDGTWTTLETVVVPAGGYEWRTFAADVPGEWVRVRSDQALASATAYFHYSAPARQADEALTASLARPGQAGTRSEGLIRPRGGGLETLQFLANTVNESGDVVASGYYEISEDMVLRAVDDPDAAAYVEDNCSVTDKGFEIDEASVIVTDGSGNRYRLPKTDAVYDEPWATGWPRGLREVVTERSLLNAHGTFYEVPRDASGGYRTMRPITTHGRMIYDFCSYRGMLVLSGATTGADDDGHYFSAEDDANAGLWFGTVDDLWAFGAPRGVGGPWLDSAVLASVPSDPYLMAGYDDKSLDLTNDGETTVTFTIEVDFIADGTWHEYLTLEVEPGQTLHHDFPDGYSAHWVRLIADTDTTASAMFTYVPEPATLALLALGLPALLRRPGRKQR